MRMIEDNRILSCGNIRRYIKNKNISSFSPLLNIEDFDTRPANMNYLDILLKGMKNDYTKLEYIAANGTQYIEIDYVPNSETCIECEFSVDKIFESVDMNKQPLYGSSVLHNKNAFEFWPQAYGFSCYASNTYKTHTGVKLNEINHVIQNKNVLTVNDTISTFPYSSFVCPNKLMIFATNRSAQGVSIFNYEGSVIKLFYLKISENGNVLHYLIPAYLDGTNESGLYDLIDGKFYQNKDSGSSFITGDVVNDVSSISNCPVSAYAFKKILSNIKRYTELQYIQSQAVSASSGSYIDLGYTPTSNVKILIDFQYLNDRNNGYCAIFGSRQSNQNTRSLCLWYYKANGFTYAYNSRNSAKTSTLFTERMSVEINKNTCKFNDGTTISNPESSFTCDQDLYLFCTNTGGSAATNSNLRIFSFKLDDGNVHLNLVPCKRNSDNVIGMIDTNTKTFYTNQDSLHPFIAGPEIN